MLFLTVVTVFTSLSFLAYGLSCIYSDWMRAEFERYHLARMRVLTGLLEILAAIGLIVGLKIPLIGLFAAIGLTLLMLAAFVVRLTIKDGILKTLPSFLYLILTLYLAFLFFQIQ